MGGWGGDWKREEIARAGRGDEEEGEKRGAMRHGESDEGEGKGEIPLFTLR